LNDFVGDNLKLQVARRYYRPESGIEGVPAEGEPFLLTDDVPNAARTPWEYYRCPDDHFVDFTRYDPGCSYLRAWAYTQVVSRADCDVLFGLYTNGPVDVWLSDRHIHRQESVSDQVPQAATFTARLHEGPNPILVRFEAVAIRECPNVMALKLAPSRYTADDGPDGLLTISVPTLVQSVERRQALEEMFEAAYLERDVYVGGDEILVKLPEGMDATANATVRLQTPTARIHFESVRLGPSTGSDASLGRAYDVPEGRYDAVLMPPLPDYYQANMRLQRKLGLWAVSNRFTSDADGTLETRRGEALEDAAGRDGGVFSEIARMALDRWSEVRSEVLIKTVAAINRREDGSAINLLAVLGIIHRYANHLAFPVALREPMEQCVLGFRYAPDEPGRDSMEYSSESQELVFRAGEVLAGQLYPTRTFLNDARTGQWHREHGERLAIAWLQERGTSGFREWDSASSFSESLVALSHLADLATNPIVYDLAAVVADKLLFSMAVNSFRGVFGSTQGRVDAVGIKNGRLGATAGVSRLLWGTGAFNTQTMATVSLGCASSYAPPPHLASVAADLPEELWNRECHGGAGEGTDRTTGRGTVNKVTYRTPDSMLCSAQDYRPGERGDTQHIWQATLGPDAIVFVNHPACFSEDSAHQPGFWGGNAVLPRVAQWKDVLIAVHQYPAVDWLGFTHAYFPASAFDESTLRVAPSGLAWAFARKGHGYLALAAARGLTAWPPSAGMGFRELRSYGDRNVWLCHLGRARLDGDFAAFQQRIASLDVDCGGLSVRLQTLRGETLQFGWDEPFRRNGVEQPIAGFPHYDNPYCLAELPAEQMGIRFGDQILQLSFV
jgi:hypothetical protein